MSQPELIAEIETRAHSLCEAINQAAAAGVPDALVLPALFAVFREAGMLPESLDFGMLAGLFR